MESRSDLSHHVCLSLIFKLEFDKIWKNCKGLEFLIAHSFVSFNHNNGFLIEPHLMVWILSFSVTRNFDNYNRVLLLAPVTPSNTTDISLRLLLFFDFLDVIFTMRNSILKIYAIEFHLCHQQAVHLVVFFEENFDLLEMPLFI